MNKHLHILKQLFIYDCEQQGFFGLANDIRDKTYMGEMIIKVWINDYLKQQ
jgi:hypothetical protein